MGVQFLSTNPAAPLTSTEVPQRGDPSGAAVVAGPAAVAQVTPAITAQAYTSGKVVGGIQSVPLQRAVAFGAAILESLTLADADNQKAPLTLLFFNASPAGAGGGYTDTTTFAWGTGDLATCVGKIDVAAADYETVGGKAVACKTGLALVLQGSNASQNLFVVAVTTGTPTYASTASLTFSYGALQS